MAGDGLCSGNVAAAWLVAGWQYMGCIRVMRPHGRCHSAGNNALVQPHSRRCELRGLLLQLEELGKAVDAAEKNAARFNLTRADLSSRRRWIQETSREVIRLRSCPPSYS